MNISWIALPTNYNKPNVQGIKMISQYILSYWSRGSIVSYQCYVEGECSVLFPVFSCWRCGSCLPTGTRTYQNTTWSEAACPPMGGGYVPGYYVGLTMVLLINISLVWHLK